MKAGNFLTGCPVFLVFVRLFGCFMRFDCENDCIAHLVNGITCNRFLADIFINAGIAATDRLSYIDDANVSWTNTQIEKKTQSHNTFTREVNKLLILQEGLLWCLEERKKK